MTIVALFPGIGGFLLICTVSTGGVFDSLELLNGFLKQVVVIRRDEEERS